MSTELNDLFPLPLTAFEEFMLNDESADYPMTFFMQVILRGVVDRKILKQALGAALDRHPLLRCRVKLVNGKNVWVLNHHEVAEIDWDSECWGTSKPWNRGIDLHHQAGLRCWAEQTAEQATLTLQFHHSCCDGIAAARFLEDIAVVYSRLDDGAEIPEEELPCLRPVNLESLRHRGDQKGRRVAQVRGSVFRRARVLLKYSVRYLRQHKVPFLSGPTMTDQHDSAFGLKSQTLDRQKTRALRQAAKAMNSSLNDLLVTTLMMTAGQWNQARSSTKRISAFWKQPVFCVLVPASLRGPQDDTLPACNVVSYVFMSRDADLIQDPVRLHQQNRDEMQLVHQAQAGWLFIQALETVNRIPGLMGLIKRRTEKSCMATSVLSHMGNLMNSIGGRLPRKDGKIQMGRLQVEEIRGIPPLRKGTSAVFSTMLMNGCLSVSMRCCPRQFSSAEADQLLNVFFDQLDSTAKSLTPTAA